MAYEATKPEPKINDEVAMQLGRELLEKEKLTLEVVAEMAVRHRRLNRIASESPTICAMIRLLVGQKGRIPKDSREKIKNLFQKLDELEGE